MRGRGPDYLLALGFLAVIAGVAPFQAATELREGDSIQALDLFRQAPSPSALRTFEKELENQSVVAKAVRTPTQYLRYRGLRDTGEQAMLGRDGWWFYRPDVRFVTERCPDQPEARTGPRAAVSAIAAFRDQLAARGIALLVMPVPGKPSVCPDMITARAMPCDPRCQEHTRRLLDMLAAAGVDTIDLLQVFAAAAGRPDTGPPPHAPGQEPRFPGDRLHRSRPAGDRRRL